MLDAYRGIVAQPVLDEVYRLAEALQGSHVPAYQLDAQRWGGG